MNRVRELLLAYARSDALPLTLLALLIATVFYDVVFFGKTLNTSSFLWGAIGAQPPYGYPGGTPDYNVYILDPLATAVSSEPLVEKTSALLQSLTPPLWNADTAMGRPLLGGFNAELTNPVRWPLAVFPSPWLWDATLLARFWIAGAFTYALGKSLGLGRTSATAAAIAYILSGYFMLYVQTPHVDYAMSVPVLLFSFELLAQKPTPLRVAFASGAVALLILTDNPEAAAIGLLFAGAYYLFRIAPSIQIPPSLRRVSLRRVASPLGPVALAAGAGLGLTAAVLLPFLELTGALPGFDGYAIHRHASGAGIGLTHDSLDRIVSLFVPYFNGVPVLNFQHNGLSGVRNYFGIVVAFLALVAIARKGSWTEPRWFFAGAGAFFIMKTYGVPVINEAGRLPLFDVIDWALYSGPCISLSVALLAGFGVHRLRQASLTPRQILALIAGMTVLGLWLLFLNRDFLDTIPKSHLLAWAGVPIALLAVLVAACLLVDRSIVTPRLLGFSSVLLLTVELALPTLPLHPDLGSILEETFGRHPTIVERPERYDPATKPPYVDFLEQDDSIYRVFGLDRVLYPNYQEAFDLHAITGFTSSAVTRYFDYVTAFIQPDADSRFTGAYLPPLGSERDPPMIVDNPMFDLTNVKYVMTRADRTIADSLESPELADEIERQFHLVYEGEVRVWQNEDVMPRAFLVYAIQSVEDEDAAIEAMSDRAFDPRVTAVVENAPADRLNTLHDNQIHQSVTFESYADNSVRLRVQTDAPAFLVLTDTYYPGWKATVDGDGETIYATDLTFRGVFLETGEHTIEFSYEPASFKAGLAIGLLSLLALGGYASYYYRWPRLGGRSRLTTPHDSG